VIRPRVNLIASRFNRTLVEQLVEGAQVCLASKDLPRARVHWVNGAFELPAMAARLIRDDKADALVALGVVIRGETPHFDYVCRGVTQGLMALTTSHAVPIGYGVVMADTCEQAEARASRKALRAAADHASLQQTSNKGFEAMEAVLDLLDGFRQLEQD